VLAHTFLYPLGCNLQVTQDAGDHVLRDSPHDLPERLGRRQCRRDGLFQGGKAGYWLMHPNTCTWQHCHATLQSQVLQKLLHHRFIAICMEQMASEN
jgi:hypothetical protein